MTVDSILERFCRYVRIDTQADEASKSYPSTPGQLELGRLLAMLKEDKSTTITQFLTTAFSRVTPAVGSTTEMRLRASQLRIELFPIPLGP